MISEKQIIYRRISRKYDIVKEIQCQILLRVKNWLIMQRNLLQELQKYGLCTMKTSRKVVSKQCKTEVPSTVYGGEYEGRKT